MADDIYPVFVYGTLRKGGINHSLIQHLPLLHTHYVLPGFSLYAYGYEYPFMLKGKPEEQVTGEVYAVDDASLQQLHVLEDVEDKLYRFIYLPEQALYTYCKYDEVIFGLAYVEGGDWLQFLEKNF